MIVLVPIVGITTPLTIRLGGKPLIETLTKELPASGFGGSAQNDARITDLTEQADLLSSEVDRLRGAQMFWSEADRGEGR